VVYSAPSDVFSHRIIVRATQVALQAEHNNGTGAGILFNVPARSILAIGAFVILFSYWRGVEVA
jgi:hypothetical protein